MNSLTTTSNQALISAPAADYALSLEADRLLTDERGPDGKRMLVAPPSSDLRKRIVARITELNTSLAPANRNAIATAIKELFVGFPSMRGGAADDLKVIVAKYVKDLEDLPLWAIQGACQRLNRGSVEGASLDFAPASARVRQVALDIVAPTRAERQKISDVLQGVPMSRPSTPAEREYVTQGFERLKREMRGGLQTMQDVDRAERARERELREAAERGDDALRARYAPQHDEAAE